MESYIGLILDATRANSTPARSTEQEAEPSVISLVARDIGHFCRDCVR